MDDETVNMTFRDLIEALAERFVEASRPRSDMRLIRRFPVHTPEIARAYSQIGREPPMPLHRQN
jgi:hypothetical protein